MENILQVELNNSIRKTSKFLSRIEVTIIEFFKKYEVSNITYSCNPDMSGKYLDIEFRTEANRVLQLQIAEREKDGIFIWPPYILSIYGIIDLYEYLRYRKLFNKNTEFNKYRIFGNVNSSNEEIDEKLHNYLKVLFSVLQVDEVQNLLYTDYWIEIPFDYKN